MEQAVRTWAGQLHTLKSHLGYKLKSTLPLHHPVFQWMVWWAAVCCNRYAARHHGRTAHGNTTGHKTKLPVACFGETVLWRKKRTIADPSNSDVEYSEGIFLGMGGMPSEFVLGTPQGVATPRDVRVLADDGSCWNLKSVMQFGTPLK